MSNKKIRTRIAPSNTGYASIGNIRTAIFNYLFAKKHGGEFILRIEDTDGKRSVHGSEEYIIKSLEWIGITPDDGVNPDGTAKYRQSEKDYNKYIDILLKNGNAYYAFDSEDELETIRKKTLEKSKKPFSYNCFTRNFMKNSISLSAEDVKDRMDGGDKYVVRFNTPKNREIKLNDLICGETIFNTNNIDDKILLKSDGMPSYFIANTIDDIDFEITHVIKGVEWLSSFPTIALLYEALNAEIPQFAHLPLLLDKNGAKISKRKAKEYDFPICLLEYKDPESNEVIPGFRELGYEPDALLNALSFLGWNPGTTQEIFSKEELINAFSLERVNNSGARVGGEKLKWFNVQYLRNKNNAELYNNYIYPKLKSGHTIYSADNNLKIVDIAMERSIFAKELYDNVRYFYEPIILNENLILKNQSEFTEVMDKFLTSILDSWIHDSIKQNLESICQTLNIKIGKIMPDLRLALTGGMPGPDLFTIMEILGQEETFNRINNVLRVVISV
jgi:glutamyl-tRNA synthetase